MSSTFYTLGLDFTGPGFFANPIDEDSAEFRNNALAGHWLRWQELFSQVKSGDFSNIHELIDIYECGDPCLEGVCYKMLAYAGTGRCLERMMQLVRDQQVDYLTAVDFCQAISMAGSLSAASGVLEAFVWMSRERFSDIEMIPHRLSDQLESERGPIDEPEQFSTADDYAKIVEQRLEELRQEHGTDQVFLFHGDVAGVVSLANLASRSIRKGKLMEMETIRERFEASTGIDCRTHYKKNAFQPLAAAAVIEEFLESPEAEEYEPGVRYFFGHRIPD